MSHKYYGFQKEEHNLYTLPFLSTKSQRLRFLNGDLVAYGQRNEFIIHKNPGLLIMRVNDNLINQGFHKQSNTENLMNEFLNQLLSMPNNTLSNFGGSNVNSLDKKIKVKEVALTSRSSIQIVMSKI